MSLTMEWRRRIDRWRQELARHVYTAHQEVSFSGHCTRDLLRPEQLLALPFNPMPEGTAWGKKWDYCWFRGSFEIPESLQAERMVLKIDTGAESCVYLNGLAVGAIDKFHFEIPLRSCSDPCQPTHVLIESYAGHGDRNCHVGPNPEGRAVWPDPAGTQAVVGKTTFGVWNELLYQLWADVETLYEARENMDAKSLRVMQIDKILKDFTLQIDFQADAVQLTKDATTFRDCIKPILACRNGPSAPVMFTFGHSHLDVAWKWPIAETIRKCSRTLSNQLSLLDEYPEYLYFQSQPYLMDLTKKHYPDLYARVCTHVREGRFMPDGGMWVEADTNLPNGESLIRQFSYGKMFIAQEFGSESRVCWLPDVFGYSGALPQIMKGCGIDYFATSKILWAYNGGDTFPYNTFLWEGIDGTRILAHNHNEYNAHTRPQFIADAWNKRVQDDNIDSILYPFGYGDGGGGATRDHLEFLRRLRDFEGMPRTEIAGPLSFFQHIENKGLPKEKYVGELYFQAHRGTYTSQAKTKKGNRRCETHLREVEMWSAFAFVLTGARYPQLELEQLWKKLLVNQFHDIITGTSIKRVYEEAEADHEEISGTCLVLADTAQRSISSCLSQGSPPQNAGSCIAFNSLSWDRNELVEMKAGSFNPSEIEPTFSQEAGSRLFVEIRVPAHGMAVFPFETQSEGVHFEDKIAPRITDAGCDATSVTTTANTLENTLIQVVFNEFGEIANILDKQTGRQLNSGLCNRFQLYRDEPSMFDAWDIDSMYDQTPVPLDGKAEMHPVSSGPLFGMLRIERTIGKSKMVQEVVLRKNATRLDFHTTVEWAETHKLLKVGFQMDIHASEALHEIQFGHIARPNHFSRQFDADRFEVCQHKWTALVEGNQGAALLNDCKYGISVKGQEMNLTLLKSSIAPDPVADVGTHGFTYSLYVWNGSFEESHLIREAYSLNHPLTVRISDRFHPPDSSALSTAYGEGGIRKNTYGKKFLELSEPNVVVEAVKLSDDGQNDLVIRLYESMKMHTRCSMKLAFAVESIGETDMLENPPASLPHVSAERAAEITLDFRAFEVKTIRVKLKLNPEV